MNTVFRSYQEQKKWELFIDFLQNSNRKIKTHLKRHELMLDDIVHLYSRGGQYRVIEIYDKSVLITCKIWKYEQEMGQRKSNAEKVPLTDIKCFHGNNWYLNTKRLIKNEYR